MHQNCKGGGKGNRLIEAWILIHRLLLSFLQTLISLFFMHINNIPSENLIGIPTGICRDPEIPDGSFQESTKSRTMSGIPISSHPESRIKDGIPIWYQLGSHFSTGIIAIYTREDPGWFNKGSIDRFSLFSSWERPIHIHPTLLLLHIQIERKAIRW